MTEKLKQTIKEEIEKLPKEAQEAINSLDWRNLAEEIGKKYLLTESEINDFQVETLLVLTGIEDGNYYKQNIENNVGTTKDEAEKITEEISQQIFIPIGNMIEENIKKNVKNKNPNAEQTLNFILSGGDYSAFLERREPATPNPIDNTQKTNTNNASVFNKTNVTKMPNTNKATNIKDNFVI